jgi:hypothetical protein
MLQPRQLIVWKIFIGKTREQLRLDEGEQRRRSVYV